MRREFSLAAVRVAKHKEDGTVLVLLESAVPVELLAAWLDEKLPGWSYRITSVSLLASGAVLVCGELTASGVTRSACVEGSPAAAHVLLLAELAKLFGLPVGPTHRMWVQVPEAHWRRIKDRFPMPWDEAKELLGAFESRLPRPQEEASVHKEISAWLREQGRSESWLILAALEAGLIPLPVPGVEYLEEDQAKAVLQALKEGRLNDSGSP